MVLVISLHRLQVVVDGGGLRIHWLDVTHLLILGFCFFLGFFFGCCCCCFFFLSFFQFSTFLSLLHSERCCTTNQTQAAQAAQAAVGAVIGRSPKSNRRSGLGHWMFPDY